MENIGTIELDSTEKKIRIHSEKGATDFFESKGEIMAALPSLVTQRFISLSTAVLLVKQIFEIKTVPDNHPKNALLGLGFTGKVGLQANFGKIKE